MDLIDSHKGLASINNTPARVQELCPDLKELISSGRLTSKAAQRLRGRMQFADAQVFGRTGCRCLKVLSSFSEEYKQVLQTKDIFFLEMFIKLLQSNIPREIRPLTSTNLAIFTDACYERGDPVWPCGIGGVAFFNSRVQFVSLTIDDEGRQILGELVKKQIFFEAETLAALVAFECICTLER